MFFCILSIIIGLVCVSSPYQYEDPDQETLIERVFNQNKEMSIKLDLVIKMIDTLYLFLDQKECESSESCDGDENPLFEAAKDILCLDGIITLNEWSVFIKIIW